MSTTLSEPTITWEKLPDDFPLPDDPVDNINQLLVAAALTESLELAGRIQPSILIGTNFGICATVDGKLVFKAPDWFYVSITGIGLFLGVWQGNKANRTGYWLRWWDEARQLLLWGTECLQQEQQLRERMAAKLRKLGVNPEDI